MSSTEVILTVGVDCLVELETSPASSAAEDLPSKNWRRICSRIEVDSLPLYSAVNRMGQLTLTAISLTKHQWRSSSHYFAGPLGTATMVASMVATTFSLPALMAKASAVQTVSVRPALFTCARAAKISPAAGARRFTLNSTERTSLSSAATVKAPSAAAPCGSMHATAMSHQLPRGVPRDRHLSTDPAGSDLTMPDGSEQKAGCPERNGRAVIWNVVFGFPETGTRHPAISNA